MIVLFEGHQYPTELLLKLLDSKYLIEIDQQISITEYVGYYSSPRVENGFTQAIIIFPKIFMNGNKTVFNGFSPEELASQEDVWARFSNHSNIRKTIFESSIWLYRAIQQYLRKQDVTTLTQYQLLGLLASNIGTSDSSGLDIVISLLDFYKHNQTFFTLVAKTSNNPRHQIEWNKTIQRQQPVIQSNRPYYLELVTTTKQRNENEDLIKLFYTVLTHIKAQYGFEIQIPAHYPLFTRNEFNAILRKGCTYLARIKHRYFSDKMIALYKLLYIYFEHSEKAQTQNNRKEVMLIKDFNLVFEDMIDVLVGDNDTPTILKKQLDGKLVDHIYKGKSILPGYNIYYIGDSKYYSLATKMGIYSKAKQFTYAKNIIQYNLDLLNQGKQSPDLYYRDSLTEGYNITPNFFISAFVDSTFDFTKPLLNKTGEPTAQYHFKNRLFDRDTLFIQSYSINFLFVLSCYISKSSMVKNTFKKEAQILFREQMVLFLNNKYVFFKVTPIPSMNIESFVSKNFKFINGKAFKPYVWEQQLLLAYEKTSEYFSQVETLMVDLLEIDNFILE